ncbi:PKD domain-containing protein [Microcella flavibacter]|uniref:PKD domain-containing protein n=1 Tax=Microcella flavibacter TaxID=1804990 RepID=UPI00145676D0|nr:PKD domain-containing protein [Microcella flavibacter]
MALLFSTSLPASAAGFAGCTEAQVNAGTCPAPTVSTDGSAVSIGGSQTRPGTGGTNPSAPRADSPSGSGGSGSAAAPAPVVETGPPLPPPVSCFGRWCAEELLGGWTPPADPAEPPPGQTAITIADLVTFRPQTATLASEPGGFAVIGLPFNPHAQIGQHVVAGTLLGQSAEVRFTPYAYRWDYGDGATARTGTPGAPWQVLGLREFDPTPTSHVYSERGTYTLTLTVEYAAEYRVGGSGWIPVAGILTLPAPPITVVVGSATTVLVSGDCRQAPSGPGC